MRKITAGALILGAGLAAAVAALPACSSELGNCGLITIVNARDSVSVAVGDSTQLTSFVVSGCPGAVRPAVDFSAGTPAIASVRAVSDSTAWTRGLAPGIGVVKVQARDRSNVFSTILVTVTPAP